MHEWTRSRADFLVYTCRLGQPAFHFSFFAGAQQPLLLPHYWNTVCSAPTVKGRLAAVRARKTATEMACKFATDFQAGYPSVRDYRWTEADALEQFV